MGHTGQHVTTRSRRLGVTAPDQAIDVVLVPVRNQLANIANLQQQQISFADK